MGTKIENLNLASVLGLCYGQVPEPVPGRKCQGGEGGERWSLAGHLMGRRRAIYLGCFNHSNAQSRRLDRLASQPQHALLWF